jgi:hypothetical protein
MQIVINVVRFRFTWSGDIFAVYLQRPARSAALVSTRITDLARSPSECLTQYTGNLCAHR